MNARSGEAYATLCGGRDPGYLAGALVLRRALLETGSDRDFVVLLDESSGQERRTLRERAGCRAVPVSRVQGPAVDRAAALCPWFDGVFDKLRAWELTSYRRVAFLDADTLVLRNLDSLFSTRGHMAAPDASCTDQFNTGVFLCEPSRGTADRLLAFAGEADPWDGGEQSVLNAFFPGWYTQPAAARLPFAYNCQSGLVPADPAARSGVAVAHFYGVSKPWESAGGGSDPPPALCLPEFDGYFARGVQPLLDWWRSLALRARPPRSAPPRAGGRDAFATALVDDAQLPAALALRASLELATPGYPLVALLAPGVSPAVADTLERAGVAVRRASWVVPPGRPPLATAASLVRLRLWQLTEFRRVVYLAPAVAAMRDVSDLFDRPPLAAAPRGQRPDTFHAGVLVLELSGRTYRELERHARTTAPATFQRCLNSFFPDWYASPAGHWLPQRDAFELRSFLYLGHTQLLPSLLAGAQLRLVDFTPFVYAGRCVLVPDPMLPAGEALAAFRRALRGEAGGPESVPGAGVPAREALLDEEPSDRGWAEREWRSRWEACRTALGIGRLP